MAHAAACYNIDAVMHDSGLNAHCNLSDASDSTKA